ncbi:four helix bundle protein [Mucilaginibacter arboris]|uniref:Four helix bundle protein n=1 Tax=Mucilaginibacter arboris TaxID=2682090 RepID=A0A7K1STX0_9SPHI|nr:four helix bundle protein [Mucilaginibacter arboris]MVN20708.1 four helix bundle protein [Mucilaginibacter arboris]
MRDYKRLEVWSKAHQLTLNIYKEILPQMPVEEKFALTSQLRRSAYSIPLNIAEGCGKNTDKDFVHYLDIALGSAHEVEYTCLLIFDLSYILPALYEQVNKDINEIKAMLISFIKYIRSIS